MCVINMSSRTDEHDVVIDVTTFSVLDVVEINEMFVIIMYVCFRLLQVKRR